MSNTATISQGQEILALQDELTGALIGLARSCGNNPKTENTDEIIIEGLVHTITNSNTGAAALKAMIEKVREEKNTNVKINFIREQLKLKETDSLEILKDKISFETLVLYKDQKCYIKGYSIAHKNCELSNACQLKISKAFMKKYKERR